MNIKRLPQIYLIFFTSLFWLSCKNEKKMNVDRVKMNISIERFDKQLSSLNPDKLSTELPKLKQIYGHFFTDYMENILEVGPVNDTSYYKQLRTVLKNKDFKELTLEVNRKFPNTEEQKSELTNAFKQIKYYYPKLIVPRVITFVSGFALQTPVGNDYIGIGLDMFLGKDSKFYPALVQSIPQYISRRFTPENITPRIIEGFTREELFLDKETDRSLLAKMVYNGKIMYFMKVSLPEVADSLIVGYSTGQMEWAETNQPGVWAYFLENNLLYETDYKRIQKYLTDAPFTPGLGEDSKSAPKLGIFIGWQIVKKYMERNPETSLQLLMKETDAQKILTESKYKPR
ncbi:MAG: gliding motility lipoprotein GldB [Flavobacterium sp.]|nr:gliding motility lipoprotein GldB [Pedobacter sp.]